MESSNSCSESQGSSRSEQSRPSICTTPGMSCKRRSLETSQKELIGLATETLKGWNNSRNRVATKEEDCDITEKKVTVDLRQVDKFQ